MPSAVSWGPQHIDVFWRGVDAALWHRWYDGGSNAWYGPESLGGGPLDSEPHPISWGPGHLDVFWRGTDAALWHRWYDGGSNAWYGPESLGGGPLDSEPHPISWGPGHLDVFWRGTDAALWHHWYDGGWHGPESLGSEPLGSDPHPVSWGSQRLDVFWRGTDAALWHRWYDGGWHGPESLGSGPLGSDPHPVSWGSQRLDVFWRGTDAALWHRWYDGGWHGPESLGSGPLGSEPQPVSPAAQQVDVYWSGLDGALRHRWYGGGRWYGPEALGVTALGSQPAPVSWGSGHRDVFWRGTDGQLRHRWYQGGTGWFGPESLGGRLRWSSPNATPPSLLWPADGVKWCVRSGVAGTQAAEGANGKRVAIVELRGWLTMVEGECHVEGEEELDWRYDLELDAEWLDAIGLAVEALVLPGEVIRVETEHKGAASVQAEVVSRSSDRAKYCEPIVHIELDGWPRKDQRGNPGLPPTWTTTNDCVKQGMAVRWPFDPRNPKRGDPPLQSGQYVRVVGSLVTDFPHATSAPIVANEILRLGRTAVLELVLKGLLPVDQFVGGETTAVKWLWSPNLSGDDPGNPARWNEIHSPDHIEVLPAKERQETVRCLAVVAQNGLTAGDVEELSAVIPAPARPTRWHVLRHRKRVCPSTIASTVLLDQTTPSNDRVAVRARVQGQAGMGASGKFFALYRVGWRGSAPALHGAVSANGSLLLGAVDADGKTVIRPGLGSPWEELRSGRAQPAGHQTVVSRAPACFDTFVVGTDGRVYTAATQGAGWGGWWPIAGVTLPQGVQVDPVSRSSNVLDIFCADTAGRVMSAAWQPGFATWAGWWWIRNGVTAPGGAVTAVTRHPDFLEVFHVSIDGRIYTASWNPAPPQAWQGWWPIGGDRAPVGAPVTCVSRSLDNLDVFVADTQGRVLTAHWPTTAGWSPWTQILGGVTAPGANVAVASRRKDYLDAFVVGTDGRIYTAAWEPGASWRGWWMLPGIQTTVGTTIAALSPTSDGLLVVTSAADGNLVANTWQPASGWTGWATIS